MANVRLYNRGQTENGKLYLTRHHLIFVYVPEAKGQSGSQAHASSRTGVSQDSAPDQRVSGDSNVKQGLSARPKPKAKEIWVPYPMINHCILRPSHSQGRSSEQNFQLEGEEAEQDDSHFPPVYGTNSYRPSSDSAHLAPYSSPQRPTSPSNASSSVVTTGDGFRPAAIRIRKRDFQMMAFHFFPSSKDQAPDEIAREVFYCLRSRCCVDKVQDIYAFHFKAPHEEIEAAPFPYDARREFARMGIGSKAAEGPGSAWRITDINGTYQYSPTYPGTLCEPRNVSDNMLKYGGSFRSKSRIPTLTYLHSNGGSISRASQPMVGIQNKRNPQDERLVSAIFTSHTPLQQSPESSPHQGPRSVNSEADLPGLSLSQSDTALAEKVEEQERNTRPKVYGSTRRNLIIDARPRVNALANRATGGGIEDVSNYSGAAGTSIERVFLDIANIHVMRKSLEKIVESFANSDYLDMKPNQELLRNSGWLNHISGLLAGAEMVARVVGLGGSHVLLHCSDGWDRTAQVAALAQVMLDPHYRSLNGFITLIQKDFLSFGHKFNHRHGVQGSEKWFEIENEKVLPSRAKENGPSDSPGLNTFGSKAFSGAKNWFEKNRNNLFRQSDGRSDQENPPSRPPSPPVNPIIHSPPTTSTKEDREHRTDTKEIAPIFHQFLDSVFQLQHQYPDAFEFNERFLRRLFYHVHAGQYGEFLFNTEKDRRQNEQKFASVWPHFLSRRQEFTNPDYSAKVDDPLLFPRREGYNKDLEVRWWSSLFARRDEEMNTPRTLAPPDPVPSDNNDSVPSLEQQGLETGISGTASPSTAVPTSRNEDEGEDGGANGSAFRQSKSMASFDSVRNSLSATLSSMNIGSAERPSQATSQSKTTDATNKDDGDPLGVSASSRVPDIMPGKLDFAAFARESAYSDR